MQENLSGNKLYNVGVSYKKADVHTRSSFSISAQNQLLLLEEAKENGIEGLFVLSTCNRTEITGLVEHPFQLISLLCKYSKGSVDEFVRVSSIHKDKEAIIHLFRLATGLDSQILGDYEIVGQLKMSFKQAKKANAINAYLERLINLVLQASKKVKNKTHLSSGTTSVSYAAVQYIINNLEGYNTKNILVYGLGKMGKHTCKNLAEYTNNKSVCLINRTEEKAKDFVKSHATIRTAKHSELDKEIANADVLIVSTGASEPIVTSQQVSGNKKLLILDLSMPNNVDEQVKDTNVTLINVDELSKITDETLARRQDEIPKALAIIDNYIIEFEDWILHRKYTPAINALKKSLKVIQDDEIDFHRKKIKDFDVDQAEIITSRFIQKITTQFAKHLKDEKTSVSQSVEVMKKVFSVNRQPIDAKDN
ncbi:MAG: glutamyl-tRNA reductase [Urechidicola sp.]|jgi:glutamyl-tRNA reductase|tara:strand:+ start:1639 stop:2904 length:1266 start_codon:yes stop_codon:yes gene_type:complete